MPPPRKEAGAAGRRPEDLFSRTRNKFSDSPTKTHAQEIVLELHCLKHARYAVVVDGQTLVERSRDPEHDVARLLLSQGITGRCQFVDGLTGSLRLSFDIAAFAATAIEEGPNGPRTVKWRPGRSSSEGTAKPIGSGEDALSEPAGTGGPAGVYNSVGASYLQPDADLVVLDGGRR